MSWHEGRMAGKTKCTTCWLAGWLADTPVQPGKPLTEYAIFCLRWCVYFSQLRSATASLTQRTRR